MRFAVAALSLTLFLAGCGSDRDTAPPSVTLKFPGDKMDQASAAADAQCKSYGKTAKLDGVEPQAGKPVATFTCQ
jgi:hypothetical protein